jgi:hypothetical protein
MDIAVCLNATLSGFLDVNLAFVHAWALLVDECGIGNVRSEGACLREKRSQAICTERFRSADAGESNLMCFTAR